MVSWKRLVAGTLALFLTILAFLAARLTIGGDPAVKATLHDWSSDTQQQDSSPEAQTQQQHSTSSEEQDSTSEDHSTQQQAPVDPNPPTTHSS